MFYQNRFTERAGQALTLAQEAAASFGHSYIGSEHLLLGLLREGGGPAAKALTAAGVTDEALVHQIEELSGRGTPDSTAPQGMTPRTKRIVELSVQSANEMGTGYVGTEHLLLLGILREGQNVGLTAFANLKITPQILVEKRMKRSAAYRTAFPASLALLQTAALTARTRSASLAAT